MILLVEDEVIIAMSTRKRLEQYGYTVVTATTGEKALVAVRDQPDIQLVLMDINLGAGADGTVVAGQILKYRDLPVVFLSSHTEQDVVTRTEQITSYGYVVKNSSMAVLDASIKMAFKLFAAKQALKEQQLELKAQNEELLRRQIELETVTAKYVELYDKAPVSYFTMNEVGVILEANLTAVALLTEDRGALINRPLSEFIHAGDQDRLHRFLRQLFENTDEGCYDRRELKLYRLRIYRPNGNVFSADLTAGLTRMDDGTSICRVVAVELEENQSGDNKSTGTE